MTEKEFIKFYKERNFSKNAEEARRKIDSFWNALIEALDKEKKVNLKNWGRFELKEVRSRKIVMPRLKKETYTEPRKTIKFKAGKGLQEVISGVDRND